MLSRLVLSAPRCGVHTLLVGQTARQQLAPLLARKPLATGGNQLVRTFQRDSRETLSRSQRIAERQTLRERAMAPVGPNAYGIGKGAVAGGALVGLGALCFYGLGLGQGTSVMNNSLLWPEYVKQRIHSTYAYFGGSVIITAASAAAAFRSHTIMRAATAGGILPMIASMALMIGSGMIVRSIPYDGGLGVKQLAWVGHCAVMGAILAPICLVGGPVLMRAAWYTAGIVGGLSTVAVCAPSDKFLYMGGPLAIGLGVVFASSMASMFLAPTTVLGAGLASVSLYGGLLLFSGFLLFDTQRIVRKAEATPNYGVRAYDPINNAISIYMDVLNIFIRLVSILSGGGGNKRK